MDEQEAVTDEPEAQDEPEVQHVQAVIAASHVSHDVHVDSF
jgi:hypothetical protein